ncbi:MAG TPA: DUF115 domain-containing protein [Spirochaetota bacterium]|nr:MAG: hypothetical protein BWX91_00291 [Spirochaetes bacterium ADurb.Bin133]HNZ26042.1 DUF115 domain-containing protein [Spirochaetota bacterium]HPY88224.1 DUF115 domain-containing protein [Spirochaetota bacterium]
MLLEGDFTAGDGVIHSYKIEKSKSSFDTLVFDGRYVHSKYRPEREGEDQRFIAKSLVSIFGVGLAYSALNLIKNNQESIFIIFEPIKVFYDNFLNILKSKAHLFDLKKILLINSVDISKIYTFILQNNYLGEGRINYSHNQLYKVLFHEDETRIIEAIKKSIEMHIQNILTESNFAYLWTKNFLYNSTNFYKYPISDLKENDQGDNIAIIAGAGPSLNVDMKTLKSYRNRYTLFATDTAIKPIIKNGIIPDFILSLDGQYYSLDDFPSNILEQSAIICDLISYPGIARNFKNIIYSVSDNFYDSIIKYFFDGLNVNLDDYKLELSGTVSDFALKCAIKLGFKNICFSGLDLSYPNFITHAIGTPLYDRLFSKSGYCAPLEDSFVKISKNRKLKKIIRNDGKTVFTDLALENYALGFNSVKNNYHNINIYNSLHLGYDISTFKNIDLNDFLSAISSERKSPSEIIAGSAKKIIEKETIVNCYSKIENKLYNLSLLIKDLINSTDFSAESEDALSNWKKLFNEIEQKAPFLSGFLTKTKIVLSRKNVDENMVLYYKHAGFKILQSIYYIIRKVQKCKLIIFDIP